MDEPHYIWRDQCIAALSIREQSGLQKALGYPVGERLLHHVQAAETHPAFARTLPDFVAAVRDMFEPHVLREYLDSVKRVGARGMFREDVVSAAEDVGRVGRIGGDAAGVECDPTSLGPRPPPARSASAASGGA